MGTESYSQGLMRALEGLNEARVVETRCRTAAAEALVETPSKSPSPGDSREVRHAWFNVQITLSAWAIALFELGRAGAALGEQIRAEAIVVGIAETSAKQAAAAGLVH